MIGDDKWAAYIDQLVSNAPRPTTAQARDLAVMLLNRAAEREPRTPEVEAPPRRPWDVA